MDRDLIEARIAATRTTDWRVCDAAYAAQYGRWLAFSTCTAPNGEQYDYWNAFDERTPEIEAAHEAGAKAAFERALAKL